MVHFRKCYWAVSEWRTFKTSLCPGRRLNFSRDAKALRNILQNLYSPLKYIPTWPSQHWAAWETFMQLFKELKQKAALSSPCTLPGHKFMSGKAQYSNCEHALYSVFTPTHIFYLFIFYWSVLKTYLGSSEARHSFHVFSISLIKFPLGTTRRWQPGNIWLIFNLKKGLSSVDLGNHCSIWDSKEKSYYIYELRNIIGCMWSVTLYHAWVNLSCSVHLMPLYM